MLKKVVSNLINRISGEEFKAKKFISEAMTTLEYNADSLSEDYNSALLHTIFEVAEAGKINIDDFVKLLIWMRDEEPIDIEDISNVLGSSPLWAIKRPVIILLLDLK